MHKLSSTVVVSVSSILLLAGCTSQPDLQISNPSLTPTDISSVASSPSSSSTSTATPSTIVTDTPVPGVSLSPTPTPLASTPDIQSYVTIKGKILDDQGGILDGATIKAVSLNDVRPYIGTALSKLGSYSLAGVPTGVSIEITASKQGYTTRTRVVVPLSNTTGGSNINEINFGDTDDVLYALSDKPEVVSMSPDYKENVFPNAYFTLKFSEPVDKSSVEENFVIRNREDTSFKSGARFGGVHKDVYNKGYYKVFWNSTGDEVTFAPRGLDLLPADKDSGMPYYMTFKSPIKDKQSNLSRGVNALNITSSDDGITPVDPQKDGMFRITTTFKVGSPFTIKPDTVRPKFTSVYTSSSTTVILKFSEPIFLTPLTFSSPFYDSALLTNATYTLKIDKDADGKYSTLLGNPVSCALYQDDITHRSVKLIVPNLASYYGNSMFVGLSSGITLKDPAGNETSFDEDASSTSATVYINY